MQYGYCNLSVIPCRAKPNDRAEIVTQLLFGEPYKLLEADGNWCKILSELDDYEAWIDIKQLNLCSTESLLNSAKNGEIVKQRILELVNNDGSVLHLSYGAMLHMVTGQKVTIGNDCYKLTQALQNEFKKIEDSTLFLNAPYLWGGKTFYGIDCSGFSQVIFRMLSEWLPRDAYQQATLGKTILLNEAKLGDLAFFAKNDKITHVGICLSSNKIIHASGQIRIDTLTDKGILNTQNNTYTHALHSIISKV
jgi:hypothetical protein